MTNLMLNVEGLYAEIRSDFDSLWSIKNRNATVEFITPYTTLGDDAISVFVTQRDNGYVVSDGGRLYDTGKEQGVELDGHKGFHYGELIAKFCVKVAEQPQTKRRFFYKMVSDVKMLSSAIYDVAHFQEAMANAVYLARQVIQRIRPPRLAHIPGHTSLRLFQIPTVCQNRFKVRNIHPYCCV